MESYQHIPTTSLDETPNAPYSQEPRPRPYSTLDQRSGDENASGRFLTGGGGTIETLSLIMTLAFVARVIVDVVNRVRNGRSFLRRREAGGGGDVGDLARRVWASLWAWENRMRRHESVMQGSER
ncbi:uncharacterized protein LOC122245436 [Penaeus japonicus]|uniref:uncharacterized protein LOC122245436 n=1 Tax=Penaeus japonicus TaxID=27405 RepID=UPI001C713F5D|nr:uncharacterized protein LOC122245436 [Penaeus japonicus]